VTQEYQRIRGSGVGSRRAGRRSVRRGVAARGERRREEEKGFENMDRILGHIVLGSNICGRKFLAR
jgi:hypothetical protein